MAYIVKVDDKEYRVDLEWSSPLEKESHGFKVSLNGKPIKTEVVGIGAIHELPLHLSLIVENKIYNIIIQDENTISVDGESYNVKVEDERLQELKKLKKGAELVEEVTILAPMPGLVIKIEVKKGDKIKAGQELAIIESMKMQNEVKAPKDGIIKQVLVKKGMTVNGGDTLIVIK